MSQPCSHLDHVDDVTPSSDGCEDCQRIGAQWVHLRMSCRAATSVLPDLKCARLRHPAPAVSRADRPSRDSLVNRGEGIRIDCCRVDASGWLIDAVALQT